ncbi:MAG: hypothetical protein HQ495_12670 [Alphaproteobacteria bacterium]|nr:hypothetical protein [Alphaproteobacteria bacterium]
MKTRPLDPRNELKELDELITDALAQTKSGLSVSLGDLEERANVVCEYLLALPALEARPYAARLERLIDSLNALEDAITTSFGKLAASAGFAGGLAQPAE